MEIYHSSHAVRRAAAHRNLFETAENLHPGRAGSGLYPHRPIQGPVRAEDRLATCITGSFIIEKIFSIPGIAAYYIEAVSANDLSIVLGETVFIAALFIVVVFLTDILYTVVDPRIRIQGGKR